MLFLEARRDLPLNESVERFLYGSYLARNGADSFSLTSRARGAALFLSARLPRVFVCNAAKRLWIYFLLFSVLPRLDLPQDQGIALDSIFEDSRECITEFFELLASFWRRFSLS
jgi:hypothetical protein